MAIVIKNFKEHYEKSDNKKVKEMKWLSLPIKFEGLKYRRLMKMSNGMEILGVWIVLLQLSAKMPERGVLANHDGDLTLDDIELMTDCPLKSLKKAIPVLSSVDIGWISDDLPTISDECPTTLHNTTEHYNTEHYNMMFEKFWNIYPKRKGKRIGKKESRDIFFKQKETDLEHIIKNAENYGINNNFPKDPERFLSKEFWMQWDEPQTAEPQKEVTYGYGESKYE